MVVLACASAYLEYLISDTAYSFVFVLWDARIVSKTLSAVSFDVIPEFILRFVLNIL